MSKTGTTSRDELAALIPRHADEQSDIASDGARLAPANDFSIALLSRHHENRCMLLRWPMNSANASGHYGAYRYRIR
jgi:hypothetical protein